MSSPSSFSATRNTCFALISSIEIDFREIISDYSDSIGASTSIFPKDILENATRRRSIDQKIQVSTEILSSRDLLDYIDFADISKIIDSKLSQVIESPTWIIDSGKKLLELAPTRNRVCHTRPLEPDDLPRLLEFAKYLCSSKSDFEFFSTRNTLTRLEKDPSYVLTLQIPGYWNSTDSSSHNLPIPEFDETGFLGRTTDRTQVIKLLKAHYPIVTIVGEGGVGKTALALRCLYDLLEDKSVHYDAIVWVSLKTSALTQSGVKTLVGAITSTLGVFSEIAQKLGTPNTNQLTEVDLINEIIQYLELYKVLIAIDNLETISTGPLRDILVRMPPSSKILITSRVGLNEFEARYALQGLDDRTSITLLRALTRVLSVQALQKLSDQDIKAYTTKLFNSPLLIKWFVASIGNGADPKNIVSKGSSKFADAIAFCFKNLFERLGINEKLIIHTLASARKPLSIAEIHYLNNELTSTEIEQAMSALHNSSLIIRSKDASGSFDCHLTESTSAYLSHHAPPPRELFLKVQTKLKELRISIEQNTLIQAKYEYDPLAVRIGKSKDEQISATYLRKSLSLVRSDINSAKQAAEEARRLTPGNSEAWRISAFIEGKDGDLFRALEHYEQAIDLDPNSKISRYAFGIFLVAELDDAERGLEQLEAALILDPDSVVVKTGKAMALSRLGRYREASAIHDEVLPGIGNRERRWRISGTDQAAECYRRWANQSYEMKEYEEAKKNFKKSISVLQNAAGRGDIDASMIRKLAKIVNDALCRRELTSDEDYVNNCIGMTESIYRLNNNVSIPIKSEASWALKNAALSEHQKQKLLQLDQLPTGFKATIGNTDRLIGRITHIPANASFGFITYGDNRFFFHKNFLLTPDVWGSIPLGTEVEFSLGANAQGPCAIDIELLNYN